MERKWTERKYHVQDNDAVELKDVKIYSNTNQFPELPFCGPHSKPHGARGLVKNYHLRFDRKIGMGVCAILCIKCVCVAYKSMIDRPWIFSISSDKQERYKPVTKCTYWSLLGSFSNWNIIELSQKSTSSYPFDKIHQVVLGVISDNMASSVESLTYGAINTTETSNNGFYVIMFTSRAYTLQENTTIYVQIITSDELGFKAQYLCSVQQSPNYILPTFSSTQSPTTYICY